MYPGLSAPSAATSALYHPAISSATSYAAQIQAAMPKEAMLFPGGAANMVAGLPGYPPAAASAASLASMHPLLQRAAATAPYGSQQAALLEYQRSLAAASAYSWQGLQGLQQSYPYLMHAQDMQAREAAAREAQKRPASELEAAALEISAKRMR